MIKKIFSSQSKTVIGAAVILGLASFVSRLIGIMRDRIFAHQFGAGDILDAYYAAFRIPDLIYNLIIVGALSAGFIPIFTKLLVKDKTEAWRVANSVFNILGIILTVICSVLFIFTPSLMQLITPGFDAEKIKLTSTLARIMFLSPILLGLSGIVSSILQSFKNFLIYSLTPIFYNLGIIIGAWLFVPRFGVAGLAYGVILGALLHLLIQLPSLYKNGFKYQPLFLWTNIYVRQIGKLMIPRTLSLAVSQFNLLFITILASTLAAGSVTIFNFANNLQYFPVGIIGVSFAIAAFPTLSQLIAENKKEAMIEQLSSTIRQIIFFIVPLTIIFLLLRAQITRVVLGSGEFDWTDTILTANTLALFSLSLFAQCLIPILSRAFYSIHDTWTPFITALIGMIVNVVSAFYFKNLFGISGLALSFSFAVTIQLILTWILLKRKLGSLKEIDILKSLAKISIATVFMSVTIQFLKYPIANLVDMTRFWGILLQGLISGIIGLLIYGIILHFLKLEEMQQFSQSLRRQWLKLWNIQGEIKEGDEI
ncbi:MAG: murein biosynthesis integral membrane protein MurJ [Candidatus Magasanikiibacteriota bacterium]